MEEYAFNPDSLAVRGWAMAVTVFAGVCMVSNFNYYSFKTINLRRRVSFVVVLLVVLSFVLVSFQPPAVLFLASWATRCPATWAGRGSPGSAGAASAGPALDESEVAGRRQSRYSLPHEPPTRPRFSLPRLLAPAGLGELLLRPARR